MDNDFDVVWVIEDVDEDVGVKEVLLLDSEKLELLERELFDVLVIGKVDMLLDVIIGVDEVDVVFNKDIELETLVLIEVVNKLKLDVVFDDVSVGATKILDDELVVANVLGEELVEILDEELKRELDSILKVEIANEELLDMKFWANTILFPNIKDNDNR